MYVYESEVEVAKIFIELSITEPEQLSRLSSQTLARISTAFAASQHRALQILQGDLCEVWSAAVEARQHYGGIPVFQQIAEKVE